MRNETNNLLSALNALDGDMAELMLGLLTDELPPDEQRRFGRLFVAAGKLLEQHADATAAAGKER